MYNGENKSIAFPAGYNSKFDLVETKNRTGPNNL